MFQISKKAGFADRVNARIRRALDDARPRASAFWGEAIEAQKGCLIYWLPVLFGIGIACYFSLKSEPHVFLAALAFCVSGAALTILWPERRKNIHYQIIAMICLCVFWIVSGFLAAQTRTVLIAAPALQKEMNPVEVTGTVRNIDRLNEDGAVRMTLGDLAIEDLAPDQTPRTVRIKVHKGAHLRNGMRVSLLAGLNPPAAPVAPGAFDFQRYSFYRQLGGVGFSYSEPEILSFSKSSFQGWLDNARQSIAERVDSHVGWPYSAVVTALSTGEISAIPEEDMEAMRHAGLAHLLALSGMNVGMIAASVFFLSRLLMACFPGFALRRPIKKYAALLALLAATGYTLFVGANVPAVRAVLMTGVVMIAIMLDRRAISMRLVALAALAILIVTPEAMTGASFQMSFAAVAALVAFYEAFRERLSEFYRHAGIFRKAALYILGVSVTTVIATLATAPFALFHFQNLAMYGVLANMVAVPLMSFIVMPFIVLSYITVPLGLGALTLWPAGLGVEWTLDIARWTSSLDGSVLLLPEWPAAGFSLIVLGFASGLILQGRARVFAFFPVLAGCLVIAGHKPPGIYVAASGDLVAFRGADERLYVSSLRSERFDREQWMRRNGMREDDLARWPKEGKTYDGNLTCGEEGCRLSYYGKRVAVRHTLYDLEKDCVWADILIAREPVPEWQCRSAKVIDHFDRWRNGAYSLVPSGEGLKISHVAGMRGHRPWHVTNAR